MHFTISTILVMASVAAAQTTSSKRGLVFVPSTKYVADNQIWVESGSDLRWYYNYQAVPSTTYSNRSQEDFEFVPMLWSPSDTFAANIKSLISGGQNITHVLGYNEPDGTAATGGSAVDPKVAATNWIAQMDPLRAAGIKVGAPAVTGSSGGLTWLKSFFSACSAQGSNCTVDFIPLHWYGDFEGLASWMGQVAEAYPNKTMWITEYALPHANLSATQSFYNTSAQYFDRLPSVGRYSYFGSFRSDVSNVGPNVAMLTQKGKLTDIGSWYLGKAATGNIPQGDAAPRGAIGDRAFFAAAILIAGFLLL